MLRKKILFQLFAVLLVLAMLAGCANGDTTTTTQAPANGDGTTTQADPDEEPTTITYFRSGINQPTIQNWTDALWIQELERRTNVKIDFQGPGTGDDYTQAASIMLASGDLTDLFFFNWSNYNGGLAAGLEDDIVVDFGAKYRDQLPNWFGILDANEDVFKAVTLDDGTSALFCHVELDLQRGAYAGLMIRQDWLDTLGLDMPQTIDEFYDVLVAFRDDDPNGSGQADTIPFSENNGFWGIRALAGSWGLIYQDIQLDPNDPEKITYWPLVNDGENFTDFVTTLNQWFNDGLLDEEFASQDGTQHEAKVVGNQVGSSFAWISQYTTWNNALRTVEPDAQIVGLRQMVGIAGKNYQFNNAHVRPAANNEGTVITTAAEDNGNIDAVLRLVDFMYSEEGIDIINWGVEGVSYEVDASGNKIWTDEVANDDEFPLTQMVFKYALPTWGGWPKVMGYDAWASIELTSPESVEAHDRYWDSDVGILTPPLLLSESEAQEYARIMTDVNTSIGENFVRFVIGTRPLEEIPDFLAQIRSMNIEDAMTMYQSAYDRYMDK